MNPIRFHLLNTSLLNSQLPIYKVNKPQKKAAPLVKKSRRTSGILMTRWLEIPMLTEESIKLIQSSPPKYITRHIKLADLSRTLAGSFKFGTITGYRPADEALIGRFSDFQEGLQKEVFKSRSGVFNNEIYGHQFNQFYSWGFDDEMVFEFTANDYCSCSSIGEFSQERAVTIRERGNPDLSAYVVYDFEKLISAIREILIEDLNRSHLSTLYRIIEYGEKDRHWEVEDSVSVVQDRDQMAIWLGTAFVKSPDYTHEEEIRIILFDPEKASRLPDGESALILNDRKIAESVTMHGVF